MPDVPDHSAITCRQCGGALDFREGTRNVLCRSCKTVFAVAGESGIQRFFLEEKLRLPEARSAVRKFIATKGVDSSVVAGLRFQSGELCFLPFWRLLGYAVGWRWQETETIVKEKEVDENGRSYEVERRGANEISFDTVAVRVDYSSPACNTAAYGLKGIATVTAVLPLKGVNYQTLARKGTLFDPVKAQEEVRKESIAQVRSGLKDKNALRHETDLTLCDERLALISYPVWNLTFAVNNRIYPVVVDGINGNILKARFPGRSRIRLLMPMATVALVVYLITFRALHGTLASLAILYYIACRENARGEGLFTEDITKMPSLRGLARYLFILVERDKEIEHG